MKVLYFATAAEAAGVREEIWDLSGPGPLSLEEFWREALRRHPDLENLRPQCRVANGMEPIGEGDSINPAQETAVLPPVSGG